MPAGAQAEEWQTKEETELRYLVKVMTSSPHLTSSPPHLTSLRHLVKEEHGDLVAQPELRNWVGAWHATSTAASFLNDEVRRSHHHGGTATWRCDGV